MKTKLYFLGVLFSLSLNAQVGINTPTPQATLHVNGNLKVNSIPETNNLTNFKILTINETTSEFSKCNASLLLSGNTASNITKVVSSGGTILSGNLFTGWDRLSFTKDANFENNFDETTSTFKVPASGVYEISFKYRYGTGIQLSTLNFGGTPRIGILKHKTSGGYTEIAKKEFSGATLPLVLSILISDTEINTVQRLAKDDVLSFEYNKGGISINLLSNYTSEILIYKISD
ncbi:hypothetical protein [Soonwooa sp.]|uniref:hypothetical protein n=1 Tax=Soonwooa sp. TaxID=1938592 RepID=UPI002611AF8E|nr:hypothetical protein [Soonwooa sp.]